MTLMTEDFPICSESVIGRAERKGQTMLRFWQGQIVSEFRCLPCGKMIWRNDGKRNRYTSYLRNRSAEIKTYSEYARELASQICVSSLIHQINQFGEFLSGRKYRHDILLRRIQELVRLTKVDDPRVSDAIEDQIGRAASWQSRSPQGNLFQASYLLTLLTLYAAAGEAMDDPVMAVLRADEHSTCPVCKHKFHYTGTAKPNTNTVPPKKPASSGTPNSPKKPTPSASSKPSGSNQNAAPAYKPQTPTRTVTIRRLMHAHKDLTGAGIKNMFVDAMPVQIYLDGEKQGMLNKDQPMVLHIDSREHSISQSPISGKYTLPAGNDSFVAFYFNGGFMIGSVDDPFRDELARFVLKMVRGQGFQDRILDPNNHYHAVEISINTDHIRVYWTPNQTKGFAEWATGQKEEKIYYHQIGLTPTPKNRQPGGYWKYLEDYVRDVVVSDPEADLQHGLGGFTFRKSHSLY